MRLITLVRCTCLAALLIGCASVAQADTYQIVSDPADYVTRYRYDTGTLIDTEGTAGNMIVGQYVSQRGANPVFIFELPALLNGEKVSAASLTLTITSSYSSQPSDGEPFNIDLWGLGFRTSTTPINQYLDADESSEAGEEMLIDDWFKEGQYSGANHVVTTDPDDSTLARYLQSFYDATPDYKGGAYVFLRINPDADPRSGTYAQTGFSIASRDSNTAGSRPFLSITTAVPEPSAFGLIALTGGLLCRRRCRGV